MKKIILASACILALSSAGAFAQTGQPAPGASGQGEVGPGATKGTMKKGKINHATGMTTGTGGAMKNKAGDSRGKTPGGSLPNTNNMGSTAGGGSGK
ncbi:hypothetical protein JQ604_18120 [Bradyrhizobium jicamae]|uniref:hypothetical protein n=1 Tax=Bradyrhizobium jicamae TaxID=280332 RepID=UPI001BA534F4|nr:hypothetical protein [Bradyrhizobium jicamae]MBR0754104.1 hypothetical protein [Bradyrhizobium jicamae]